VMVKKIIAFILFLYSTYSQAYVGSLHVRCINCTPIEFDVYMPRYFNLTESIFLLTLSLIVYLVMFFFIRKERNMGVITVIVSIILVFLPIGLVLASYGFKYHNAKALDGIYQTSSNTPEKIEITHEHNNLFINHHKLDETQEVMTFYEGHLYLIKIHQEGKYEGYAYLLKNLTTP
jgi:hypothetical protein